MYSRATASSSWRFSRSTAASAGFTAWLVRVFTSKAQDAFVPAYQVDFTPSVRRPEITGNHNVAVPSKVEISIFFTSLAGAQVFRDVSSRQGSARDPVENADGGMGEAPGKHG
jgi:hypothetical protein